MLGLQEWIFELFLLKHPHNSGENDNINKQFKLVLKTVCNKVFIKYQLNQRVPSLIRPPGMNF